MAIIYRKIESLKTLSRELKKRKINRFNSILEVVSFMEQFDKDRLKVIENTKSEINRDIILKRERIKTNKKELNTLEENLTNELTNKIGNYITKLTKLKPDHSNLIIRLINRLRHNVLLNKLNYTNKNFDKIIRKKSKNIEEKILTDQSAIDYILNNKEKELSRRSKSKLNELTYIYVTLKDLYPFVLGALGENMVVTEIEKLPDDYILINDFNLKFDKPIYNKRKHDRIFSIQIDHLLISPAGIFLIETKNWSKNSLNNQGLWSPVEQIQRSGYAMFTILNKRSHRFRNIGRHHWGESQIPLKNLIVMINNKPKNSFKYVKVLKLNELIHYISYFDKIYSKKDINKIAEELLNLVNR